MRGYRAAGGRGRTRGVRLLFLAPTRQEARDGARAAAELYFAQMSQGSYLKEAIERGEAPARASDLDALFAQLGYIVGDPDEAVDRLNAYIAETGVDQLDAMVNIPRVAPEHAMRTIRLLQEKVRHRLIFTAPETPSLPEAAAS